MSGRLIVLDGLDGSGKHTQAQLLLGRLEAAGLPVKAVSFPDYAQPSSVLVRAYLAGEFGGADQVNAYAASSFYAVDRYASYRKFWQRDYLAGGVILADRYATSNLIHQMPKLPPSQWPEFARWLEEYEYEKLGLPRPDLVLYLDMHPEVSRALLDKRYGGDPAKRDIHEADLQYLLRCRECALQAAGLQGWRVIPCSDAQAPFPQEEIAGKIWDAVQEILHKL